MTNLVAFARRALASLTAARPVHAVTRATPAAFANLVRVAMSSAEESTTAPAVALVATVLNCTQRWDTFPDVPADLVAIADGVLRGRADPGAWAEAVSAVLTAVGVEHEAPRPVASA